VSAQKIGNADGDGSPVLKLAQSFKGFSQLFSSGVARGHVLPLGYVAQLLLD
jgi:hypothetical protein